MGNSGDPAFPSHRVWPLIFMKKNIRIQILELTFSIALLSLGAACSGEEPESTPMDSEPVPEHGQPDIPK